VKSKHIAGVAPGQQSKPTSPPPCGLSRFRRLVHQNPGFWWANTGRQPTFGVRPINIRASSTGSIHQHLYKLRKIDPIFNEL